MRRHVRSREGGLAFLPGLVRSPSIAFDRARDGNVARVVARNDALREAFGVGTDARVVPPPPGIVGRASVKRGGVLVATADAVALATSRGAGAPSRGRQNPSLDEPARKACVALLDTMPERSAWEVSTFGFATDEPTSWALAAWVVDVHAFAGLVAIDADDGVIFVALRDVRAEAST